MCVKVSVYVAQSLDGYIARENGDLDWLDNYNRTVPEGEDLGYKAFMNSVDILIMGRNTYEKVLSFGNWPYKEKKVIVLSTHQIDIPETIKAYVTLSNETPNILYERLSNEGIKLNYVDGADTIQRFMRVGLVDEITITLIPTLLGSGISLFGKLDKDIQLELISSKGYDFGFSQLIYRVIKE